MKALIISFVFPPCATGAATVMYNLCKNLPKKNYIAMTAKRGVCVRWGIYDKSYELDCSTIRLPVFASSKLDRLVFSLLAIYKGLLLRNKRKVDCILAVYPYFNNLLAAYVLHRLMGVPFVVYMHDLFSETMKKAYAYKVWVFLERKILLSADYVLVMNEEYVRHYSEKSINNLVVLSPSIDLLKPKTNESSVTFENSNRRKLRIVFTGSIYAAHEDAVLAFLRAAERVDGTEVLFATPTAKGYLPDHLNQVLRKVNLGFLPKEKAVALQRSADVLFLPLAIDSPYPEELKVAFPCKLLEYLAAGKPVLAVVPKESFVESFVKKNDVGIVVTELSTWKIAEAIEKLKDEERRKIYAKNALETVTLFDAKKQSERLFSILERVASGRQ